MRDSLDAVTFEISYRSGLRPRPTVSARTLTMLNNNNRADKRHGSQTQRIDIAFDARETIAGAYDGVRIGEPTIVTDGGMNTHSLERSRRTLTQILNLTTANGPLAVSEARLEQVRSELEGAGYGSLATALPRGPIDADARYHIRNVAQQIDEVIDPPVQFDRASNWGER